MVLEVDNGERPDIHEYNRRMGRALRRLNDHPGISGENKRRLLEYLECLEDEGLSLARRVTHLVRLTRVAELLNGDFESAGEGELRLLMRRLRESGSLSDRSLEDYQNTVKRFWRWLKPPPPGWAVGEHWNPPETAWMRSVKPRGKALPKAVLTREEKDRMVEAAEHPRDKAFIEVCWDSGARPSEVLSRKIGDVEFDRYGAVMKIRRGKTGDRRVRLIESTPALTTWLNNHPQRDEGDAPLWVNVGTANHGKPWDYYAARKAVREAAEKAGIKKPVTLYSFRHGRATHLANHLTEAQLCQRFGWIQGSRMPGIYVHLSGRDVDESLLELYGLKSKGGEGLAEIVKACPRCEARNPSTAKFCSRCGSPLNLKIALEVEERVRKAEEMMETLLKDPEVKAFLAEKLRKLGLAEKPA